jgi:hypothetical protein
LDLSGFVAGRYDTQRIFPNRQEIDVQIRTYGDKIADSLRGMGEEQVNLPASVLPRNRPD